MVKDCPLLPDTIRMASMRTVTPTMDGKRRMLRIPFLAVFLLAVLCGFLGAAFSFGPLVADTSLWFTARRGLAVGIVISGNYLAGAVWPPILQHYFDQQGWRATFSDLSWFTLCTMLPLSLLLARRPPTEHRRVIGVDNRPPAWAKKLFGMRNIG